MYYTLTPEQRDAVFGLFRTQQESLLTASLEAKRPPTILRPYLEGSLELGIGRWHAAYHVKAGLYTHLFHRPTGVNQGSKYPKIELQLHPDGTYAMV